MAKSGVKLADGVKDAYGDIKQKKTYSYLIFCLNDDNTEIQIDSRGGKDATFNDFKEQMLEASHNGKGRYAVYDLKEDKDAIGKLVFICWLDDDRLSVREKMLYASSKSVIKMAFEGISTEIQLNDESDFDFEDIKVKSKKGKR